MEWQPVQDVSPVLATVGTGSRPPSNALEQAGTDNTWIEQNKSVKYAV